jgi:hypothetical protein
MATGRERCVNKQNKAHAVRARRDWWTPPQWSSSRHGVCLVNKCWYRGRRNINNKQRLQGTGLGINSTLSPENYCAVRNLLFVFMTRLSVLCQWVHKMEHNLLHGMNGIFLIARFAWSVRNVKRKLTGFKDLNFGTFNSFSELVYGSPRVKVKSPWGMQPAKPRNSPRRNFPPPNANRCYGNSISCLSLTNSWNFPGSNQGLKANKRRKNFNLLASQSSQRVPLSMRSLPAKSSKRHSTIAEEFYDSQIQMIQCCHCSSDYYDA